MNRVAQIAIVLAVVLFLFVTMTFTVNEKEKALKTALGEIVEADYDPGLHFRIPFYHKVHKFDGRILTLDARPERVLTNEKKNMIVDAFVKWRVTDPRPFFTATGGDENRAGTLLSQVVRKAVLDSFGKRTVQEVVSGDRAAAMQEVLDNTKVRASELGITIVDVRVKKVEWPESVLPSVYNRMDKERATVAKAFRSSGEEQAQGIRADAVRQREEILATAYSEAEEIRGEGDAVAAEIYAKAYGANPEFYRLYRSLNAYGKAFEGSNNVLLLTPESEFFRYFDQSNPDN